MLKFAICDDDIRICEKLQSIIEELCEAFEYDYNINVFYDGESILEDIKKSGNYDIIFLDIEMQSMTGIDVGRIIRDIYCDEKTKIVYVTAFKDYVFEAFNARPMNYIIKPLQKETVESIIIKAIGLIEKEKQVFNFKVGHHLYSTLLTDILYFESIQRKIKIVSTSKIEEFYGRMSDLIDMNLPNFIQIHRSYLINAEQIKEHTYSIVLMKNGQQLSIGQNRRKEVLEKITEYTLAKLKES